MRILIITEDLPYPPISGQRLRTYSLLRHIAREHKVWLAALLRTPGDTEGVPHLQEFCWGVETANYRRCHPLVHLPGLLRYAVAGRPLELKFQHSEELARKIWHLVSTVDFDIVQIEHSRMALYLETLPRDTQCKSILVFYDVAFQQ